MIYGSQLEFLEKYNSLLVLANKGLDDYPDYICNYLVKELEFQSVVLFKVLGNNKYLALGKSHTARKNYIKGTEFICKNCKYGQLNTDFAIGNESDCEIAASEFVTYEICVHFKINISLSGMLKIASRTPFNSSDTEVLKKITEYVGQLLNIWFITHGGVIVSTKSHFPVTVSETINELRTPANSIIGFTAILSEESLSSTQTEYVSTIKRNAQSLLLTINELNELAKIEASKVLFEKKSITIKSLVKEIVDIFKTKTSDKNIQFNVSIDPSVPLTVDSDEQKLKYILNTLIFYSLNSSNCSNVSIEFKLSTADRINVNISADGNGYLIDKSKSIFDPFVLNKLNEFRNYNLSGISLILARKYSTFYEDDLTVSNNINSGISFSFSIKSDVLPTDIENKLSALPKPVADSLNRILVVEDDYATSKLLSNYLNKWGYAPTIVHTAEQTLEQIEKFSFLAIILDIEIPTTNGLELLKRIHENSNSKNTPVIVCSVEPEEQKAFLMGAVEYFVKPINYNFLVEVLTSYKLRKDSNVLCVDDDYPTLNLVKQAIETAGYRAIAENISANVMDRIRNIDVDLAIVDLDMPYPNGFELIKMIKSETKFERLPIIIYTGKDNYQEDLKKIDGLFEELLDKRSTNIEDLADVIKSMINRYDSPPPVKEVIEKKDTIKILLAEDYKHSQIIVTRLLKKNNFESIVVVENGEEAVKMCTEDKFDLILMDMQMPIMNGFEAMEKIREMQGYEKTPIIALTAFAMKGDREKCIDAGATDYIPKPIDSKEFIEKVKYYTNKIVN
ncbi:MAG TPA: response regulator [Melioribacteraceae bacterium]|nr:response regulator [Melioribacteraceae bacterium]